MKEIQTLLSHYVRETLFCPETGMIYDYRTSYDPEKRFSHLPGSAEIAADFPNPCGWGTGMEDCTLNAGLMLSAAPGLDCEFAAKLIEGLEQCATIHGRPGFFARGISCRAPRQVYSNTSRDQLTLAVYGLWRQWTILPDGKLKDQCSRLLELAACDCEKFITKETHYNLLRLDGGNALVSKMWECDAHEALRLPMVYAAAYAATRDEHFKELAAEKMPTAVAQTLAMENISDWWDLPTVQMQLSVRMLFESGIFPEYTETLREILERVGDYALQRFEPALRSAEEFAAPWENLNENWRLQLFRLQAESITDDASTVMVSGKAYLNPVFPEAYRQSNMLLRQIGCWMTVIEAGNRRISDAQYQRIRNLIGRIDLMRCGGDGPLRLLHGLSQMIRIPV